MRELAPDLAAIADWIAAVSSSQQLGVVTYDFVSRYFAPAKGIPEDPVTGGAHCMLAPYWAAQLKPQRVSRVSGIARGGEINCRLKGQRVELEGSCVFYMEGTAEI